MPFTSIIAGLVSCVVAAVADALASALDLMSRERCAFGPASGHSAPG